MKESIAEFIGNFILVFAGTSAIVINDISGGVITHVGIAMVIGLVVAAIIYTEGTYRELTSIQRSPSHSGVLVVFPEGILRSTY